MGGNHVAFVGINDKNGVRIVAVGMVDVSLEQAEANLKLILGAPKLLAALQNLMAELHEYGAPTQETRDKARAAIEEAQVKPC